MTEQFDHKLNSPGLQAPELQAEDPIDQECAEFQSRMADRIGAGEDLYAFNHMKTCPRCPALLKNLEYMAESIRIALQEPVLEPGDDLWDKIETKIKLGEA